MSGFWFLGEAAKERQVRHAGLPLSPCRGIELTRQPKGSQQALAATQLGQSRIAFCSTHLGFGRVTTTDQRNSRRRFDNGLDRRYASSTQDELKTPARRCSCRRPLPELTVRLAENL